MVASVRRRIREPGFASISTPAAAAQPITLMHILVAVAAVMAIFVVAEALETAIRLHTELPYYDQWAVVADYDALRSGAYGPDDWISQHNEHRPLVPRLVLFGDLYLLGGRNYLPLLVNVGLQFVAAALFAGAAFHLFQGRARGASILALSATVSLALQFTTAQVETFILPFQVLWTIGYTAGTGAVAALSAARGRHTRQARHGLLALAVVLAAVSQYSVANGLWVWLLLLAVGLWRGVPRLWLVAIAVAGAALTALYFIGYTRPPDSESPFDSLARPDRLVDYILVVMGSPILPLFERWGARLLGAFGVAAIAVIIVDVLRHGRRYNDAAAFLVAQVAFSSLTIGLIALGRSSLGISSAEAPRYVMPAASVWTCIIILAWQVRLRLPAPITAGRFATAAAALLIVTAAASPWKAVGPYEDVFNNLSQTRDALRTGVYDDAAIVRIYPDPAAIRPYLPILERYNISLFRGDSLAPLLDQPLAEHFGVASGLCLGFFDTTLDARSPAGVAVSGWAWDPERKKAFDTILIAGPDGIIRGLATTKVDRLDVIGNVGGVTALNTGWFGYSRPTGGPATAYAVVAPGVVCPLGNEHDVVASR
jgi:hypothetical protein